MDLKSLFIKIDNELQDYTKTMKDCLPLLSSYNSLDYIEFITKNELDKLLGDDVDYIRIPISNVNMYSPQYFDAYILVWSNRKFSRIHNHPERGCILKVLKGSIEETRYSNPDLIKMDTIRVNEGETSYIHDNTAYHKVKNADETRLSISLHIYAPKGYKVNYF